MSNTELIEFIGGLSGEELQESKTWEFIKKQAFRLTIEEKIKEYCQKRDEYNYNLKPHVDLEVNRIREEMKNISWIKQIKVMSSYSSGTNLMGSSDVDIGILVEEMTKEKCNHVEKTLLKLGYTYKKAISGYFCYSGKIIVDGEEIEVEIKVRDCDDSKDMVKLHDYLDNKCDISSKKLYTYLKFIMKENKKAYDNLKIVFFNNALITVAPNTTWFFTGV